MSSTAKLTAEQIENLAKEIREFLSMGYGRM